MTVATKVAQDRRISRAAGDRWSTWRKRLWPESGAVNPNPALDGLRAVAALLVLLFHAWSIVPNYIQPGQSPSAYPLWYAKTGVNLFFVLSGFLLFLPYAQWLLGIREQPDIRLFYKRRALRVVPAYWASLIIIGILLHPAAPGDLLIHFAFLSNTNWDSVFSINGVYWTMAIEVQFYVTLPLIALGMYALARRIGLLQAIVAALLGLFALSVASTYLTHIGGLDLLTMPVVSSFLVQYAAMPYWLGVFACGIACSLIYTYATKIYPKRAAADLPVAKLWTQRSGNYALLAGVVLLILLSMVPFLRDIWMQQALFGLGYAGILFGVLFGSPSLRWPLANPVMRFVGLISYSFYIWHHAALIVVGPKLHGALAGQYHTIVLFVIGLAITIPIAYLSYQVFERPFIAVRMRAHESTGSAKQTAQPVLRSVPQAISGGVDDVSYQGLLGRLSASVSTGIVNLRQQMTQRVRQIGERSR